jgi:sugar phosphate isomerase/epimerase
LTDTKIKLGINRWFGYSIAAETSFKLIKDAGFDNVLLWWGDEFEHELGKKELLPDMARAAGLHIENVHMTFARANALWEDTEETELALIEHKSCIESCRLYEIPTAVIHLSKGMSPPPYSSFGMDNIKRLVAYAEKNEVNIAIENIERMDYTDYVLSSIKSDRLKLCYDSGHDECFIKSNYLNKYADRIIALHLHDNDGTSDQHLIPGDSNIDWENITKALSDVNYTGAITLECANKGHELYEDLTPEEFLEKAYSRALRIANLMENTQ